MRKNIFAISILFASALGLSAQSSTCPATPTAPSITGTLVEGTKEIKGTAAFAPPGCATEIQVFSSTGAAPPAMLALDTKAVANVAPDGTFSVKLQTPLPANQNVRVTEVFVNTIAGAAAPGTPIISSAVVAVQPAPAAPTAMAPLPEIAGSLREGANVVTGTISKLPGGAAAAPSGAAAPSCTAQLQVRDVSGDPKGLGQLLLLSGGAAASDVSNGGGAFTLTLQEPMRGGQVIRVDEVTSNCSGLPARLSSSSIPITVPGDWGRVRGYFTSGILLSQNQNSFSQSSIFLGFNLDKTWRMPGYYHQVWIHDRGDKEAEAKHAQSEARITACQQAGLIAAQQTACDAASAAEADADKVTKQASNCSKADLSVDQQKACDDATSARDKASAAEITAITAICPKGSASPACNNVKAVPQKAEGEIEAAAKMRKDRSRMSRWPGINTFFDVRLTSIPVSACNLPNGASGTTSGSCAAPAASPAASPTPTPVTPPPAPPSPTPLDTFLSQRKTARFTVGAYLPFTLTSWTYNKTPNALFIAPLAKVGFDTPAGDLTNIQSSTTTSSTTGTTTNTAQPSTVTAVNQTSFYNFYGYGARFGHYGLTSSRNEAPELISYLDVICGRYSNLESLIIPEKGPITPVKRTRLYRLGLEGVLKIPSTPLILGFSANVGQESLGLGPHTIVQRAGDDLRFLFGARFDAAKLMSVIAKAAP
jgi:hypothetical protein